MAMLRLAKYYYCRIYLAARQCFRLFSLHLQPRTVVAFWAAPGLIKGSSGLLPVHALIVSYRALTEFSTPARAARRFVFSGFTCSCSRRALSTTDEHKNYVRFFLSNEIRTPDLPRTGALESTV